MILSLNPGSSSIKYKLFGENFSLISSGDIETDISGIEKSIEEIFGNVSQNLEDIEKVAIRVVHGGTKYHKPTQIDKEVIKYLEEISHLAPLHNPVAVKCAKYVCEKVSCPVFAVFDTSFFAELPEESITYALPRTIANKYGIRKFGFHGISHNYAAKIADPDCAQKLVTIHLGAGCSVAAVVNGKPIMTSMGMTPDEGLVMRTRSGNLDPGILLLLASKLGVEKAKNIIENESGLLGLTEITGEMWDVLYLAGEKLEKSDAAHRVELSEEGRQKARLSLTIYCNRIKEYIGAYAALMGGIDKIVFTGKIGWSSSVIRDKALEGTEFLGYKDVMPLEPNEELAIAQEV